ncbi:MAG: type I DNA topoisomerase [Spirochaetia bacterium]
MATAKASKKLIIVESPHKAKIIQKFLGNDFIALSSLGHVRDLPKHGRGKKGLGIDVENDYLMSYEIIKGKEAKIDELKKAANQCAQIFLAPDPDREGEAIAWHLQQALQLDPQKTKRITYQSVTKQSIINALEQAREINMNLVNAQQARRALDRLVGFNLSPFLWKKIAKSLSAGRVQSPAVRMVAEREKQILAFQSQEYWSLDVSLQDPKSKESFRAHMTHWAGERFDLDNPFAATQAQMQSILDQLKPQPFSVTKVESKEAKTKPNAPFITSTLQQAANVILRFSATRTMRIAQSLYEGIEVDGVATGLITYMRTDSTSIDPSAITEVRNYISSKHGTQYLPEKPNMYSSSNKNAQEAHEAIRPVSIEISPDRLKDILSRDEWNLYDLIWRRFLQSQMPDAQFLNTTAYIQSGEGKFEAKGRVLLFDGFLCLDRRGSEEDEVRGEQYLPDLTNLKNPHVIDWHPLQHFTKPPARYTEASLVKSLEKEGIGRPSTYAPIIQTILQRGYVIQKSRAFYATELGIAVNDMLDQYFHNIVDYQFTAGMETKLDNIEDGSSSLVQVLDDFYQPFKNDVESATEKAEPLKGKAWEGSEVCPLCQSLLVVRYSKNGAFLGCSKYPECKGLLPMPGQEGDTGEEGAETGAIKAKEIACQNCDAPMVLKKSRFGQNFYACSRYPECKTTLSADQNGEPIKTPEGPEQICDKCGKPMVVKSSRRGPFLACSGYPECKNALSISATGEVEKPPIVDNPGMCEKCNSPMAVKKGRTGWFLACTGYPKCKNAKPLPGEEKLPKAPKKTKK